MDRKAGRVVANELSAVIPAAISATDNLEASMNPFLPGGDNLSITLSSPQFSQALLMFWAAFQSGLVAPVIKQFGLGTASVEAANKGNIEEFVCSLEEEVKNQPSVLNIERNNTNLHKVVTDKDVKPNESSGDTNEDKKTDDDEGMNLD
ncbi:proteasomal ubiquitin receptor ADRM1 [Copidosoma floridanum]|uniref:proteasomal ubiquitin receptor ADRM1 n=1 Tax=Copidosoma floridanum TaxID=29053 RepID=UPI000C6F4ED3|nr:proteasomal ubiquitin receptor ADRM1 [Copidosoma floridanum]